MKKTLAVAFALFALLVVAVVPTFAQTSAAPASATVTITEAQVNAAYAVTNPRNRNLSNVVVDLQPGQVAISATYSTRGRAPASYSIVTTLVPTITNGRVNWTVTTASVAGSDISDSLLNQINASIESSWRRYVSSTAPLGRVTAITITESDVTYTYTPRV